MKLFKKLLSITVIAMLVTVSFANNTNSNSYVKAANQKTIKIAYLPLTHAFPLYVEKEKYKNVKIELIKFSSWSELSDALNSGKVDGASILIELAMKAKAAGIDLKAVALGHRDGNAVVVSKDIKTTKDLKGKTIAIPHRLSSHNILLYKLLKDANMTYKDIKVVELTPPEMPAALAEGRISGYIVAEPFGAKSVAGGVGKALYKSSDLWKNSICCALVLRNDFIKNNKSQAKEFVKYYLKAGKYLDTNLDDAKKIFKKYVKVDDKVLNVSLKWISYSDLKITETDYNQLTTYIKELNLIKNIPTFKDFVDSSLVDGVK
jgi:NitT/TauT family transport system substrate-binding protein